jgi:hypothetical protein
VTRSHHTDRTAVKNERPRGGGFHLNLRYLPASPGVAELSARRRVRGVPLWGLWRPARARGQAQGLGKAWAHDLKPAVRGVAAALGLAAEHGITWTDDWSDLLHVLER